MAKKNNAVSFDKVLVKYHIDTSIMDDEYAILKIKKMNSTRKH